MEEKKRMVNKYSDCIDIDGATVLRAIEILRDECQALSERWSVEVGSVIIESDGHEPNEWILHVCIPEPDSDIAERETRRLSSIKSRVREFTVNLENLGYTVTAPEEGENDK